MVKSILAIATVILLSACANLQGSPPANTEMTCCKKCEHCASMVGMECCKDGQCACCKGGMCKMCASGMKMDSVTGDNQKCEVCEEAERASKHKMQVNSFSQNE